MGTAEDIRGDNGHQTSDKSPLRPQPPAAATSPGSRCGTDGRWLHVGSPTYEEDQ